MTLFSVTIFTQIRNLIPIYIWSYDSYKLQTCLPNLLDTSSFSWFCGIKIETQHICLIIIWRQTKNVRSLLLCNWLTEESLARSKVVTNHLLAPLSLPSETKLEKITISAIKCPIILFVFCVIFRCLQISCCADNLVTSNLVPIESV